MAKDKKRKYAFPATNRGPPPGKKAKIANDTNPHHKPQPLKKAPKHAQKAHSAPTIPFTVHDHILLLGDGDLSFARSIVSHHGCADVVATTFDSLESLLEKYPQAKENIAYLEEEGQRIMHGVDATKLTQKELRRGQRFERVVFNFPHVGGRSRDVNRQVRYNQEMLVSFFKAATPLLASDGTIIVTLFEGEPYTLWNIRDLARHSGLEVQRSFRFQAAAYPGYSHARTLGNIEGGGGWKGEDREARSYIFQAKKAVVQEKAAGSYEGNGPPPRALAKLQQEKEEKESARRKGDKKRLAAEGEDSSSDED
ncbi:hypothetical protein BDV97DRAFT_299924 [Delphinella strobiligena]|nr:hypothetical protein BDV97DRAFT_299924 [Delphinella strobiligena]